MRRLLAAALLLAAVTATLALAHPGAAQVPPLPLPTSTTTTTAPPPPEPEPEPEPAPEPEATTTTTTTTTAAPVPAPESPPTTTAPPPPPGEPAPSGSTTSTVPVQRRPGSAAALSGIAPAAVTGTFGLAVGAVLALAFALIALASAARQGGIRMTGTRRTRLLLGLACLGLAALVGLVGWLKLSLEPEVNRQIPYLASAGMALVLLAAVGGALIVAEQLRSDDRRIEQLEAAVRHLADTLAPSVEAPARRGAPVALVEADEAEERETAELAETVGRRRPRRTAR